MIFPATPENIENGAQILKRGGLVAMPTETVYGLAADAFNPRACARIFEAKKRPFFDPLIVHIDDISRIDLVAAKFDPVSRKIAEAFWPGPLTIILPRTDSVPEIVTSGLDTVAIRMPRHPVSRELIKRAGTPLAAPSANPFGYLSPTEARHVEDQLGSEIDMILDGGSCEVGLESTIVKAEKGRLVLLRPGGISVEALREISGVDVIPSDNNDAVESPGQLPWHYAPAARLIIIPEGETVSASDKAGFCAFRAGRDGFRHVEVLSPSGDLEEAAFRLFSSLRRLDSCGAEVIYAEMVPDTGIGKAVMNRLLKAAAR